jgi:hypothetical protein
LDADVAAFPDTARTAQGLWDTAAQTRAMIFEYIRRGQATQNDVAHAAGISQGQLSQILRGKKPVSIFTLDMLAEEAGVAIHARLSRLR